MTQKRRHSTHKYQIRKALKGKLEEPSHSWSVYRSIDRPLISEEVTLLWLSRGDLKGEPGSETIVVQDQALQTKYHATKILQRKTEQMQIMPRI